eukprot:XP_019927452.1 PREDICTED: calponin homology domain-containing protein DDB_G0272472 isoform X2 [Crassostrea gigas]
MKKDEKEQKAGIKEQKIKPETVKHRKISENAAEVPFPKKGTKEEGKTTPHKKMKGTKEERKPQSFRHKKIKVMPKTKKHRKLSKNAAKIFFLKRKEILKQLEENRKKYKSAKQKLLETKKKIQDKRKEKKDLALLPAKSVKDKKLINKRKKEIDQKIKKYVRICRVSVKEMRRWRKRQRRLQRENRYDLVFSKNVKEKERRKHQKHRIMVKILPKTTGHRHVKGGAAKVPFSKRKEISKKLEENREKYNKAKQKIIETKKKIQTKLKEKKELMLLPSKTIQEKKSINKLTRQLKTLLRICRISRKEMKRRRERRRRLQEKYRREWFQKQGTRNRKHRIMKIIPGSGRERYVPRGVGKISFSKRKELSEKLKDNKTKYQQAKQKLLKTKKELRAKIKEEKELSLLPAKTLKEKKLIQKRKEKLKQKIKKYRRICRISVKELRRSRERRRRLQEKYRREKVITKRRRYPKKHTMKIIPGAGRKPYVPRGGVKISFAKNKEILEKLKDNKNKYKQGKQKLLETKEKLRAKIKEKKELSLIPAKTLKRKKLIQKRKDKLQQKIEKYRRICRISVKELRRSRERRRRLQEKYRREKVITKRRRYPKKHTMKIIPGAGRKPYVPRGGVKISFAKTKEILEKLKDNKKKYKQGKQKLLETKEQLRAKIKEKKELSLIPAKTLKKKKLIQKRKDKLQQKIEKYRRICRISVKELRRSRERRRRLQEKYRRKIIPGAGRKPYVPRGGVKISFAKTKEILEKLKDNKKKYKQAKQKLLETKEKLRAKIKEKKELSLIPAKTLKKKKLIQKRKDKLQQKIKKYRRICRISVKELRRSRERKRRLQEKYLPQKTKQNKRKSMRIVPSNRKTRKLTKGTMKIMFKRRNPSKTA